MDYVLVCLQPGLMIPYKYRPKYRIIQRAILHEAVDDSCQNYLTNHPHDPTILLSFPFLCVSIQLLLSLFKYYVFHFLCVSIQPLLLLIKYYYFLFCVYLFNYCLVTLVYSKGHVFYLL